VCCQSVNDCSGFDTLGFVNKTQNHSRAAFGISNSYLFILATSGIIGIIAFGNLIFHVFSYIKTEKYFVSALLALLIHAFFNNTLFYAPIAILIFLSLALFSADKKA